METVTLAPLNSSPAHRLGDWGATDMFIGSPAGRFPYRISELGGVRLII
jgi:hypothetical protein